MDAATARIVNDELRCVISYGGKISAALHQYTTIAERLSRGFEGSCGIVGATLSSLKQIETLLQKEAESLENQKLFSSEGLSYTRNVVKEVAKSLVKAEETVIEGCLPRKEFTAHNKHKKKTAVKMEAAGIVPVKDLKVEEKAFLNQLEKAKWNRIDRTFEGVMDRLYDLQLHLLLVFQVVTVGALSTNTLSGKVDVQEIVTFHERVHRTADLVGIKLSKQRVYNRRRSFSDSSDSESDRPSRRMRPPPRPIGAGPPPPPRSANVIPPPPPCQRMGGPPPPPPNMRPPQPPGTLSPPPAVGVPSHPAVILPKPQPLQSADNANPPSYTETPSPTKPTESSPTPKLVDEKKEPSEKSVEPTQKQEQEAMIAKLATPEPRLFATKPLSISFKLKSFFRSKESLAAEMRKALCDTDSHLLAFMIQNSGPRLIPHSAFHSLESTHMRTILTQLNDDTWYTTYTSLNPHENMLLHNILYPWVNGKTHERNIVALKVVKEQVKPSAWLALLRELRPNTGPNNGRPQPPPPGRVLLAIVREQFVDGKPLLPSSTLHDRLMGPPPPPGPPPPRFIARGPPPPPSQAKFRPPPPAFDNPPSGSNRVYDITNHNRGPPPPPGRGPHPLPLPITNRPPPPPGARLGGGPPPPPPSVPKSIRVSDMNVFTDHEASLALTSFNEYTMRTCEPSTPLQPRSWLRVSNTLESSDKEQLLDRIDDFFYAGKSVIEVKMRLTEDQADQVTRLMDELMANERDARFEWCWVELSVYDHMGEVKLFANSPGTVSRSASQIHLIAKRSLKAYCKPLEVYNALMRGGPLSGFPPRPPIGAPGYCPPPVHVMPARRPSPPREVIKIRSRSRRRDSSDSSSSSYESDRTYYSSDFSVARRLRRKRTRRQNRKSGRGVIVLNSDDSDADDEVDDLMKIDLKLKRGDDVVQKLLERWTPQAKTGGA